MHLVSTNVGDAATITFNGKEIRTGIFKHQVNGPIRLGKEDVETDAVVDRRYHGGIDKACYLYSADHYPFWKEQYPDLDWAWGMFGENLTVSGLDESTLHVGDTFRIGTATVQVSQPRQPCFKLGVRFGDPDVVRRFIEAGKPGAYVRVLEEGAVKIGDALEPEVLKSENPTLQAVFHLIYNAKEDTEATKRAIETLELA